jgi:TPR repeat protein
LADEGNAEAQYWLADIYADDDPDKETDVAKARALLEKPAAQGSCRRRDVSENFI